MNRASECYRATCISRTFYRVCMNGCFNVFIILCITVNTVTLSMDRYPIDYDFYMNLEITNNVCTFIFVAEMFIKLLGLGLRGYLTDGMNQFDALIVIISLTEFGLAT